MTNTFLPPNRSKVVPETRLQVIFHVNNRINLFNYNLGIFTSLFPKLNPEYELHTIPFSSVCIIFSDLTLHHHTFHQN